jgi:hypothetical protein
MIELDADEARLVLRALGGRLSPTEIEEAKQLGDKLTELRAAEAKNLHTQMASHVKAMRDESHPKADD